MIYLDTPNDSLEVQPIKPTIFPDGTSQVWKIGIEKYVETGAIIYWYYENEAEVMQLLQLKTLLEFAGVEVLYLYIPYLPYGRQDKVVTDETTFARMTFETLLEEYFEGTLIMALDIHSPSSIISDVRPVGFINHAFRDMHTNDDGELLFRPDVILVFPDKGAKERYKQLYPEMKNYITMDKVRNQSTGKIDYLEIADRGDADQNYLVFVQPHSRFLIVDDISDYGGTFKMTAKALLKKFPQAFIGLYVTHYLGHGGIESFKEAGIQRIYTSDSLTLYRQSKGLDEINQGLRVIDTEDLGDN